MEIHATNNMLDHAVAKIRAAGGVVAREGCIGTFSVKGVKGRFYYAETAELLQLTIMQTPFMASQEMVEYEIRKFFNN